MDFAVVADHRVKIGESKKERQELRFCQITKKAVEHESDGDTNWNQYTWNGT